jgi:hypothetical protein
LGLALSDDVAAVEALAMRSCIVERELIACDANWLAGFQLRKRDDPAIYCAFDLLQYDGRDLRDEPIEARKAELSRVLGGCGPGLVLNAVFHDPGPVVFEHALQARLRGHREQAARLTIRRRPGRLLAQGQKPGRAGGAAGGGSGLGVKTGRQAIEV